MCVDVWACVCMPLNNLWTINLFLRKLMWTLCFWRSPHCVLGYFRTMSQILRLVSTTWDKLKWFRMMPFEGCRRKWACLFKVLTQHLCGETEENPKKPVRIAVHNWNSIQVPLECETCVSAFKFKFLGCDTKMVAV